MLENNKTKKLRFNSASKISTADKKKRMNLDLNTSTTKTNYSIVSNGSKVLRTKGNSSMPKNKNNNNNNINYDYLYNKNNIIFNINNNNNNINKNNEKINLQAVKKELHPIKQNESQNDSQNKSSVSFKVNNMNKIDSITSNDDKNKKSIPNNNKHIFIIEEDKKVENDKLDENTKKGDNIKNENYEIKKKIEAIDKEKQKELSITPNNLLYSLEHIDETSPNKKIDNNNIHFNSDDQLCKKYKNSGNNLNKGNEGINLNQNNIIGFQSTQHINDFNAIKYNSNLGLNDFNNLSQGSFTLLKNPYFNEINNLYHNSLHGMDQDDFRQLINQSNENLFRSCFSLNHSSQNFYPILNNVNYASNNAGETMNVNNLNYQPVNQIMPNNSTPLLNLNNNNFIKTGVTKEKKNDVNNNDNQK